MRTLIFTFLVLCLPSCTALKSWVADTAKAEAQAYVEEKADKALLDENAELHARLDTDHSGKVSASEWNAADWADPGLLAAIVAMLMTFFGIKKTNLRVDKTKKEQDELWTTVAESGLIKP